MVRFATFLLTLLLASPASAASDEDLCNPPGEAPVMVRPFFETPSYDYTRGLAEVQALANDPEHAIHSAHRGVALGLTQYEPELRFNLPVKAVRYSDGRVCAYIERADVDIGYRNVIVFVPREVPQGTCGFETVLGHEQKHIDVNKKLLDEYAPRIGENLAAYLRANRIVHTDGQAIDDAIAVLRAKMKDLLHQLAEEMTIENERRQQLVDSPEEYRRIGLSCNGQLSRVTNSYRGR